MKRYQITVDGRTFDVRLLSDPLHEQVQVEVDGEVFMVEIQAPAADEEAVAGVPLPAVAPHPPPASFHTTEADLRRADERGSIISASHNTMTAPLPGVVKSIAVRPGQPVGIGDELLIIEAMKMDNIIRATRQGVIGAIYVTEGHRVAHGERMLEVRQ